MLNILEEIIEVFPTIVMVIQRRCLMIISIGSSKKMSTIYKTSVLEVIFRFK